MISFRTYTEIRGAMLHEKRSHLHELIADLAKEKKKEGEMLIEEIGEVLESNNAEIRCDA